MDWKTTVSRIDAVLVNFDLDERQIAEYPFEPLSGLEERVALISSAEDHALTDRRTLVGF